MVEDIRSICKSYIECHRTGDINLRLERKVRFFL